MELTLKNYQLIIHFVSVLNFNRFKLSDMMATIYKMILFFDNIDNKYHQNKIFINYKVK